MSKAPADSGLSLWRKLMLAITVLVLLLLAANALVSIANTRQYFAEQLTVLAQDTSTSLGLTISHAAKSGDLAQVTSMIDVIFDRGFYISIRYRSLEGEVLVSRERDIQVEGVPDWFISSVYLPARAGRAEVVSGWYRLGEVEVSVHPGYAYRDLWQVIMQQVWLFFFTAALSYGLAGAGLRVLLTPLREVENQADAICRKEFPVQEVLPKTPELRRMVMAMNRMVLKLQTMFQNQLALTESLRRERYLDPLTQLSNRDEFDARITAWMKSEQGGAPSVLILLHIDGLRELNDRGGRHHGDRLLIAISDALGQVVNDWPEALVARRSGGDFSIFIPGIVALDVIPVLDQLKLKLTMFESVVVDSDSSEACGLRFDVGAVTSRSVSDVARMLNAADESMREYVDSGGDWALYSVEEQSQDIRPAGEWLQYLQEVLEKKALRIYFQPVFSADDANLPLHYELLARVWDNGQLVNAGVFWPLVERYGFVVKMDHAVVEAAMVQLVQYHDISVSVNLSPRSLMDDDFLNWLESLLASYASEGARLKFELPEKVLKISHSNIDRFIKMVGDCGASVAIDHFGVTPSCLGSLQNLALEYVKIDRRFVHNIHTNSENRFYVQSLLQIAQSCDVALIAEGVETEEEWDVLSEIGVDGGQGFWFARPAEKIR